MAVGTGLSSLFRYATVVLPTTRRRQAQVERSYQALYYPFIHFRDEAWIKAMSLYWEGVSRIVPGGYVTRDGDDVRALIDAGVVSNVTPDQRAVGLAASAMSDILNDRERELVQRYGLERIDAWLDDPTTAAWSSARSDSRLAYIHVDKLNHGLIERLQDAGLARSSRDGDWQWVGMHPRIVDAYMVALADALAARHAAHPLTDDFAAHHAVADGRGVDPKRLAEALFGLEPAERGYRDAEEMLVAVAFEAQLPDLRRVPIDDVLELRRRTEEARLRFQDGIALLISEDAYAGAGREAVGREVERLHRAHVATAVAAYSEEARNLSIDVAMSLLSVKTSFPLAVPLVAATVASGPIVWATGALAVGVSFLQTVSAAKRARRTLSTSDPIGAYLAELGKSLPAKDVVALSVT